MVMRRRLIIYACIDLSIAKCIVFALAAFEVYNLFIEVYSSILYNKLSRHDDCSIRVYNTTSVFMAIFIKTHDRSRGQKEAGRTQQMSELFTCT